MFSKQYASYWCFISNLKLFEGTTLQNPLRAMLGGPLGYVSREDQ